MIVRTVVAVAVLGSVAAAFACSSSSSGGSGGGGGASWPGTYNCTDMRSYTIGDAGGAPTTTTAMGTLTVTQNGNEITATISSDAGSLCAAKATVSGNTATVEPNQMCMVNASGITATITITSGMGTLSTDGKMANVTFAFNIDSPVTGSGMDTATCTRM